MEKKSFLLYLDQTEAIECLSDEQAGKFIKAVYQYSQNNTLPETNDPAIKAVFMLIKSTLDRDSKKYENVCKRNKSNRLKGLTTGQSGRPKSTKTTTGQSGRPKGDDSDRDSDSGNERDSDRDKTIKEKYLDFVLLTKDEHNKLSERFGLEYTSSSIERLNNYIGSKGKKYKSHYHTILSWANKNGDTPLPVANKVVKTTAQLLEEALS